MLMRHLGAFIRFLAMLVGAGVVLLRLGVLAVAARSGTSVVRCTRTGQKKADVAERPGAFHHVGLL